MNKKIAIGAAAAVAVIAVGYTAADRTADARAVEFLEGLAADLGTGEQLTWTSVDAEPLSRRVVVEGLTYTRADGYQAKAATIVTKQFGTERIGAVDASSIVIAAPGRGEMTVQSITAEDVGALPEVPEGMSEEAAAAFLIANLTADRLAVADLAVTAPTQDAMLALAGATLEDIQTGRYGRVALTDLKASAPDGSGISFGTLTAADLDLSTLAGADAGLLQRASGNLFGMTDASITDVQISGIGAAAFTIGAISVDGLERMEGTLVSSRLKVDHLSIPAAAIAAENRVLGEALQALGQERLDASIEAAQHYVADGGAFTFGPLRVRGEGLGEAVLQADFRGVPLVDLARALDAEDFAAAQMMAADVSFVGATLTYTDDRLADVLVDTVSDGDRAGFAEMVSSMVRANAGRQVPREEVGMIADAVQGFLTGANGFAVTMQPEQPVLLPVAMVALQAGQAGKALALTAKGH